MKMPNIMNPAAPEISPHPPSAAEAATALRACDWFPCRARLELPTTEPKMRLALKVPPWFTEME